MLATLNKKLIFEAEQSADYTIANFSQTINIVDLTKYSTTIADNVLQQASFQLVLEAKSFPEAQILFNQFVSNPNANAINFYFVITVQTKTGVIFTEIGQLQTVPANTNNYLIKDSISLLGLASYVANSQNNLLSLYIAFPTNTGTSALTFNKGLYTGSSVVSTIKLLV